MKKKYPQMSRVYKKYEKWCRDCETYLGFVAQNKIYCDVCLKKRKYETRLKQAYHPCPDCGKSCSGKKCFRCSYPKKTKMCSEGGYDQSARQFEIQKKADEWFKRNLDCYIDYYHNP